MTVEDDGPGIASPAEGSDIGLWGLDGFLVVNAMSERFVIETVRDGVAATTTHVRGREVSPVRTRRTRRRAGTRIEFRPDVKMFGQAGVPLDALARRLDELAFLLPALRIPWHVERPTLASRGLRGMVARTAACRVSDVLHRRQVHASAAGPIDVEVALTWQSRRPGDEEPHIDSFVKLQRTREHGAHVERLLAAVAKHRRRSQQPERLVAAVSVILAEAE